MRELVLPYAKNLDAITQSGFYQTPDGMVKVTVYTRTRYPAIKEYVYSSSGLAGIIMEDGRHYTRRYKDGEWTAWELKK